MAKNEVGYPTKDVGTKALPNASQGMDPRTAVVTTHAGTTMKNDCPVPCENIKGQDVGRK